MNKKKRMGKKWGKIKLLETSAVGIPMYDDAINKSFNSLIKALTETEVSDELNLEESPMEEGEAQATPESEVSEPEQAAEPAEAKEEPAEKPAEEAPAEEVEKGLSKEDMMEMMTKGFQAAIKASSTPRGLVEEDEEEKVEKMKGVLGKKSLGELAIMNGMFKAPDMYGKV